jgi:G3E family GTPase
LDADESDEEEACADEKCAEEHDHKHEHAHAGDAAAVKPKKRKKKVHDLSQVSSVGFKFPGSFDVPKFNMFMSTLLQVYVFFKGRARHARCNAKRALVASWAPKSQHVFFVRLVVQAKSADIYRSKGILSFAGQGATKFVFQGVHETINFGPSANPWAADEERVSKIVFIGRGLNREELKAGLEKCLAPGN